MIHVDPDSKAGQIIMVIGLPICAVLLTYQAEGFYFAWKSRAWPSVGGLIESAAIKRSVGAHGSSDDATAHYAYAVDGVTYRSARTAFGLFRDLSSSTESRGTLREMQVGSPIVVYYDPRQPSRACLHPGGFAWEDGLIFVAALCGIFVGMKRVQEFVRWNRAGRPRRGIIRKGQSSVRDAG